MERRRNILAQRGEKSGGREGGGRGPIQAYVALGAWLLDGIFYIFRKVGGGATCWGLSQTFGGSRYVLKQIIQESKLI